MSRHPMYRVWMNLKQRCGNPKVPGFVNYGGRGITVCARWANSFETFYADVGGRPFPGASIERVDNDGPYAPDNVKWATRKEQNRNRRDTHRITFRGVTRALSDWAERIGIDQRMLRYRLLSGFTIGDFFKVAALTEEDEQPEVETQ